MTILRILEIMLYVIIDLFPSLILALLPFRGSLRFSKGVTAAFILVLYFFIVISRILSLKGLAVSAFLTVLWILLYLGFYVFFIRAEFSKILFVLLTILNYGSFTAIILTHFTFHRFPQAEKYSLCSSGALLVVYLVSYPFIFHMMNSKLRSLIAFPENNRYWKFLWLVPATFCLSYYYNLYANGGVISYSASLTNTVFAIFFNAGALFASYLVMRLLEESNANLALKAELYQLNMQTLQYENLKNRIEDARRARHDLKQSLVVIQSYIKNNDKDALLQYMSGYLVSLPPDTPIVYCENNAVNALIVYYGDRAAKQGIAFRADAAYPASLPVDDADAVVLLGNLLENALEACLRQTEGSPFILLHIRPLQGMLIITLDNSYSGVIMRDNETFLSSKEGHNSMGISSAEKIAEKYKGYLQIQYEKTQFHVSVTLHLQEVCL